MTMFTGLLVVACTSAPNLAAITPGPSLSPFGSRASAPPAATATAASTPSTPAAVASPTIPSAVPIPTATPTPTPRTPGSWTATERMVGDRTYHTATLLLDGTVLVTGGVLTGNGDMAEPSATAELYDPDTGAWTSTGSMTEIRYSHTATLLADGRVLVVGGASGLIDPPPSRSAELYDPATRTWTATGSMKTARLSHTATRLPDGRVLILGGWDFGAARGPGELYQPTDGTWTAIRGDEVTRVYNTVTLLLDGTILVVGGVVPGADGLNETSASAAVYDAAGGTWTATGAMAEARDLHTATLLGDGGVLIVGGESGPEPDGIASAELYDPDRRTWRATGAMAEGRSYHTATLLDDGTAVVTGNSYREPSATVESYDHRSGTWTSLPNMIVARSAHTATLLLDGRLLVVGGNGARPTSAEIYGPRGG